MVSRSISSVSEKSLGDALGPLRSFTLSLPFQHPKKVTQVSITGSGRRRTSALQRVELASARGSDACPRRTVPLCTISESSLLVSLGIPVCDSAFGKFQPRLSSRSNSAADTLLSSRPPRPFEPVSNESPTRSQSESWDVGLFAARRGDDARGRAGDGCGGVVVGRRKDAGRVLRLRARDDAAGFPAQDLGLRTRKWAAPHTLSE